MIAPTLRNEFGVCAVTLNITMLTRDRIYQSSDFRLTEAGSGRLITDASTKAIGIATTDFFGLITYTGVGRWHGKDTAQYIIGWLEELGNVDAEQITAGLADRATRWLARLGRTPANTSYPLSIVLAYFRAGARGPQLSVLSNFEDAFGRRTFTADMQVHTVAAGQSPLVVVTGCKPALSRDRLRWLQSFARRHRNEPEAIRAALVRANAEAAESAESRGTISQACTVFTEDREGMGFQTVAQGGSPDVRSVAFGKATPNIEQILRQLGLTGSGGVVQSASVTIGSATRELSPVPTCRPRVQAPGRLYELVEVVVPGAVRASIRSINASGLMVGDSSERTGESRLWIGRSSEDIQMQPVGTEVGGPACLSETNLVAGSAMGPAGYRRAVLWQEGLMRELDADEQRDSAALAVSDAGVVVGWSSVSGVDRGQLSWRPAIWGHDGSAIRLDAIPAQWGQAVAVAEDGDVLLWLHEGLLRSLPAIRQADGEIVVIGGGRNRGVIPVAMTVSKRILGVMETPAGRLALAADGTGPWRELGTGPDWEPAAWNDQGDVVGYLSEAGFRRPWLREKSGEVHLLPYYSHHHCQPLGVNALGDVVGVASADHGQHAVLWRRVSGALDLEVAT